MENAVSVKKYSTGNNFAKVFVLSDKNNALLYLQMQKCLYCWRQYNLG